MKCVLLAAGASTRLRPLTNATPKCLLKVGGVPLLQRLFNNLRAANVNEICIVTGFKAASVRKFVRTHLRNPRVTFINNPDFLTTNNAVSLSLARPFAGDDPFLLLDTDILFGKDLLKFFLTQQRKPNRVAVRVRGQHDKEEIKVAINRWDHIQSIGKDVPLNRTYGESIGIEVFSPPASGRLFELLEKRSRSRRGRKEFYEAAFQDLVTEGHRLWAVDVSEFPCIEIDTPEDLAHAEEVLVPQLDHA